MATVIQHPEFRKWLLGLRDEMAKSVVSARLTRMEAGNLGDAKPVGSGVSEGRIHWGPGYRIYFIQEGDTVVVMLCGGDKDDQQRNIRNAKRLAKEYRACL